MKYTHQDLNQMKFTFRQSTQRDLEFVTLLHHATLREYIEPIWGWNEDKWNGFVAKWFAPQKVQIICLGKTEIGILAKENKGEEVFLESISLLPENQNRGLGSAIVGSILKEAKGLNLPVALSVLKTNLPAKKLYERLGFQVVTTDNTHVHMKWHPSL